MDDLLQEFLTETGESLEIVDTELVKFESNPNDKDVLSRIFRLVHTIKGTCGFLGLPRLEAVAHSSETMLGKFRDGELTVTPEAVTLILESLDRIKELLAYVEQNEAEPDGDDGDLTARLERAAAGEAAEPKQSTESAPSTEEAATENPATDGEVEQDAAEPEPSPVPAPTTGDGAAPVETGARKSDSTLANQSIRVNVDVLENLMTMVSELVLTRNQLLEMVRHHDDSEFKVPLQRLSGVTAELQESVMKTRMQPIGNAWSKLPRLVRDLSHELGKKIDLQMIGAETELDRQVLELIKDPLTHMIRNSGDHGLETPAERREAGKSEMGTITLRAYHEGGHILIEVSDDGRGLNTDKIKAKAIANGLVTESAAEGLSESQIQKFIFHPGLSTAAKVSNVSGRGVGMDVVRTNIEEIGGSIDLTSKLGAGTSFQIKIPLTLAIVSALIVSARGQRFAVPQLSVVELVRVASGSESRIEAINGAPVLRLRNQLLPLVDLGEILGLSSGDAESGEGVERREAFIVVAQVGARSFGIVVDSVFDTEEIVVKPAATILRDITMFSGNTILGDGSVIMIIDPNGIAAAMDVESAEEDAGLEEGETTPGDESETTSLLVFRAGGNQPKAVPLSLVTRLEEIEAERIEVSDGQSLVQYRGRLMPVVAFGYDMSMKEAGRQPVLVFTEGERAMGLAVDEIVDIVEETLDVEIESGSEGVVGSAVVKGQATEVIDVSHYLTLACSDWFAEGEPAHAQGKPRRILLVDDSSFFRNMIIPALKLAGFDVAAVSSAAEAFTLREEGEQFDLIISDIEMPDTDGFDFARQVRASGP